MYCSTITWCHRKTAACHVTNPSMRYNYCFTVLNCTYAMLLCMPLTNKVSSSSSSSPSSSSSSSSACGPIMRDSSRKMRVLAHFTIHMVEFIQLYTNQPHTWLGFRHHPSSNHTYGWTQSQIHGIIRNEPHCG